MEHCFICTTCGVQYSASAEPPAECIICSDDRQYVNSAGQEWTTLGQINRIYKNVFEKVAPDVFAIYTIPSFAIGQRAHLVVSPAGNVLWDCITVLDETTVELINGIGGISAIAISHPHYFSTICEWSQAFGDAPVYIHAADRQWVMRPDPAIHNAWIRYVLATILEMPEQTIVEGQAIPAGLKAPSLKRR